MLHILLLTITCLYFPQTYAANAAGYDPSLENVLQESLTQFTRSEPSRIFHPEQSHSEQSNESQDFIKKVQSNSMSDTSGSSSSIQASATRNTPRVRKVHFVDPTRPKNISQNFPKGQLSSTNSTPTMPFTSPVAPTPYGTDSSTPSRLSSTPKEPTDFKKLCEDIAARDPLFEHWAHLQVISRNKNPLRTDNIYETMFNLYGRYSFSDYIKDIDMLYNEILQEFNAMIDTLNQPITYKTITKRDAYITRKGIAAIDDPNMSEEMKQSTLLFLIEHLANKYPIAKIIYTSTVEGISLSLLRAILSGILACQEEEEINLTIQYLRNNVTKKKNFISTAHAQFKQSLPAYFSSITKQSKSTVPKHAARPSAKRIPLASISEQERYNRIQQRAKQQDLVMNLSL